MAAKLSFLLVMIIKAKPHHEINADGTGLHQVTNTPESDRNPIYSADGKSIIFSSSPQGVYLRIYSMNLDGTNRTEIKTPTGMSFDPEISPDGKYLVYSNEGHMAISDFTGKLVTDLKIDTEGSPSWENSQITFVISPITGSVSSE